MSRQAEEAGKPGKWLIICHGWIVRNLSWIAATSIQNRLTLLSSRSSSTILQFNEVTTSRMTLYRHSMPQKCTLLAFFAFFLFFTTRAALSVAILMGIHKEVVLTALSMMREGKKAD